MSFLYWDPNYILINLFYFVFKKIILWYPSFFDSFTPFYG